jgi:hypothetical protein
LSLKEAFADGSKLVSRLRELGFAVDFWIERAVRVNKPLNLRALAKLACDCHPEFNLDGREQYVLPTPWITDGLAPRYRRPTNLNST